MENQQGLVHLYCGDGKGKTTAAIGLGVRAAGRGLRVLLFQFLKDSGTGELIPLQKLGGAGAAGGGKSGVHLSHDRRPKGGEPTVSRP